MKTSPLSPSTNRRKEAIGILLVALAIFLTLSFFAFFIGKTHFMGHAGNFLSGLFFKGFGYGIILLLVALGAIAIRFLRNHELLKNRFEVVGYVGVLFSLCVMFNLVFGIEGKNGSEAYFYGPGGVLGFFGHELLRALFGNIGTGIFCIALFMLAVLLLTPLTWKALVAKMLELLRAIKAKVFHKNSGSETTVERLQKRVVNSSHEEEPEHLLLPAHENSTIDDKDKNSPIIAPRKTAELETNLIIKPPVKNNTEVLQQPSVPYVKTSLGDYQFPSLEILDYQEPQQGEVEIDKQAMFELAQRLEKTLSDYQVKGRVTQIRPGPVVTMYEFAPSPGTKLSKITALANDLAMSLEALRVRIIAPIPGKAAVGIEVPNRERETVYLKEILSDQSFINAKSRLTLALGKDIAGGTVCVDLAKMPHLLVAGTTGSGKSVSVNGMITSLLFHATPEEVKLIMIDPKMLELSIYEGIPHLLLPVVTDPKKANLALKWAVQEMERRYELISKAGVRDIGGYNRKVEASLYPTLFPVDMAEEEPVVDDIDVDDEIVEPLESTSVSAAISYRSVEPTVVEPPLEKLPYIVVLIDEFADLMMVASKEVEISVARIAQKARAAGIHLIVATQRPSVDVITGLIKANFPSRIAFQVASRIDSRTILDAQGAEALLGMGDMLFMDRGQPVQRIHGALVTDTEIHRLVEHLKKQGRPVYNMDILKPRVEEGEEDLEDDLSDEMYDQAVRIVTDSRQASISMIQRRLRVGYNRAARMIERMEKEGIVSAADGARGREVLARSLD